MDYNGTSVDTTAAPSSALDVGNNGPMDYLGAGLSKLLDTYVQIDAHSHTVQPAQQATYRVPGTGQVATVGGGGIAGISGSTLLLLLAAGLALFLVLKK